MGHGGIQGAMHYRRSRAIEKQMSGAGRIPSVTSGNSAVMVRPILTDESTLSPDL
jgi:hypothetical protein